MPSSTRPGEGRLETKPCCLSRKRGVDFCHDESQITRLAINEIPEIGLELVVDVIDEAVRAIKMDLFVPTDEHPQQTIKSIKMIDMRVRNEHVLKASYLSWRQRGDVAKVEQNRPLLEQRLDIERRIAGSPIYQHWMQ